MKTLITDSQSLVSASRNGSPIPTYDDGFGPLFISRDSMGINGIVRAQTREDAYGICEDEFFPEASETVEELKKEYGFKREQVKIIRETSTGIERPAVASDYPKTDAWEFVRWETKETPAPDAWSENELFQEAFGFRPNGPNATDKLKHGIYAKDLNGDFMDGLTPKLAEELQIEIVTEEQD